MIKGGGKAVVLYSSKRDDTQLWSTCSKHYSLKKCLSKILSCFWKYIFGFWPFPIYERKLWGFSIDQNRVLFSTLLVWNQLSSSRLFSPQWVAVFGDKWQQWWHVCIGIYETSREEGDCWVLPPNYFSIRAKTTTTSGVNIILGKCIPSSYILKHKIIMLQSRTDPIMQNSL